MVKYHKHISDFDPELSQAIAKEEQRQEIHLELIASENYASTRVLEVQGSVLTNKYAEGYPGKRYYGGCEFVDTCEKLAIKRAKRLFDAKYVNVQPHSGSQANTAVYLALATPGDTIMGMSLSDGGHLTHGSKVNVSGKVFNAIQYGVDKDLGRIDYKEVEKIAKSCKPKIIVAGCTAYSRNIDWSYFRHIADEVGAYLVVDMAHIAGLVAADLCWNPIQLADVVTTTTHKTLRGPRGGMILSRFDDDSAIAKKLNSAIFPGIQGGPLMHIIAAKAVALKEASEPDFRRYQARVINNAKTMAHMFMDRGYKVVSGGTDNHLFLVDFIGQEFTGKDIEGALSNAFITVNKNTVPGDPRSPFITSGLRVGTPAMTTRGMDVSTAKQIGHLMCDIIDTYNTVDGATTQLRVRDEVIKLCKKFPVYGI